jgi:hypothetical protein
MKVGRPHAPRDRHRPGREPRLRPEERDLSPGVQRAPEAGPGILRGAGRLGSFCLVDETLRLGGS